MPHYTLDEREPHIDSPRRPPLEPGDLCEACADGTTLAVEVDSLGWPLCKRHAAMDTPSIWH